MSIQDLLFNDTVNKEWSTLNCFSLDAKTLNAENINTTYLSMSADGGGDILLSLIASPSTIPVGCASSHSTFNRSLNRLILSGVIGANLCCYTDDGTTWTQIVTAANSLSIGYSPTLNIYSCVGVNTPNVYTSATGIGGYVAGVPAGSNFQSSYLRWNEDKSMFLTPNANPLSRIYYSLDGSTYLLTNAVRQSLELSYSSHLGMFVSVGANGSEYSTDGINWNLSPDTYSFSSVCWSDSKKMFIATPYVSALTTIYTSTDGINWTEHLNKLPSVNLRSITYINSLDMNVIVGDGGVMLISNNGIDYKEVWHPVPFVSDLYDVVYIEEWGYYIASGITVNILVSPRRYK